MSGSLSFSQPSFPSLPFTFERLWTEPTWLLCKQNKQMKKQKRSLAHGPFWWLLDLGWPHTQGSHVLCLCWCSFPQRLLLASFISTPCWFMWAGSSSFPIPEFLGGSLHFCAWILSLRWVHPGLGGGMDASRLWGCSGTRVPIVTWLDPGQLENQEGRRMPPTIQRSKNNN